MPLPQGRPSRPPKILDATRKPFHLWTQVFTCWSYNTLFSHQGIAAHSKEGRHSLCSWLGHCCPQLSMLAQKGLGYHVCRHARGIDTGSKCHLHKRGWKHQQNSGVESMKHLTLDAKVNLRGAVTSVMGELCWQWQIVWSRHFSITRFPVGHSFSPGPVKYYCY